MMEDLRLNELASHIVAWHNRHPLARRIEAAQVQSMGYVVLPFVAPGPVAPAAPTAPASTVSAEPAATAGAAAGPSLRERAMARARQGEAAAALAAEAAPAPAPAPTAAPAPQPPAALQAAFSEDFIPPLAVKKVARWVLRHGRVLPTPRSDAPVRHIAAEAGTDPARLQPLWLMTALVQVGDVQVRLLIGAGEQPPVLGRRLWSRARLLSLAGAASALVAATLFVALRSATPADGANAPAANQATPMAAPLAASAASGPPAAEAASAAETTASTSTDSAASAPGSVPSQPDEHPSSGQPGPVSPARPAAVASASAVVAPAFALSTRPLRTRTESRQVADAMRALLASPAAPGLRVEVLPAGSDWRVIGWPYAERAQAERARALLAQRGLKVEVIEF